MNQDAWISSGALVERMNFAMSFARNRLPGVVTDWDAQLGPNAASMKPSQKIALLEQKLFHGQLSPKTREAVLTDLVNESAQPSQRRQFPLRGMAMLGYKAPALWAKPIDAKANNSWSQSQPVPQRPAFDRQTELAAGLLLGSPDFQYR